MTQPFNAHFIRNLQRGQYLEFGTPNTAETIKMAEENGYRKGTLLSGDTFTVKQIIQKGREFSLQTYMTLKVHSLGNDRESTGKHLQISGSWFRTSL